MTTYDPPPPASNTVLVLRDGAGAVVSPWNSDKKSSVGLYSISH